MAALTWDASGTRWYETGVKNGVLYVMGANNTYGNGVAWNGLTAVTESPSGAELTELWADDMKYAAMRSAETFGATIEAYTYPDEFAECDGSKAVHDGVYLGQQARKTFGFVYVTSVGNDTAGDDDDGYKIHIIYNATVSPSEKAYQTINDSPDAITFSWELSSTPINVTGHKPVSTIVIDSTKADATKLAAFKKTLFGDTNNEPTLPSPDLVLAAFAT